MTTQFLLSEINAFLRKRDSWFSMQDLLDFISLEDEAFTRRRLSDLLIGGGLAYVIPFDRNGTEAWIGRNRFFSGKVFPIQVSDLEREEGIFIAGSRFLPFLKPGNYEHEAKIFYKGKEIPKKKAYLPFERIANFYFLYTENDVSHVLCESDEENKLLLSESDDGGDENFTYAVSVWDFSAVYEDCGFTYPIRLFVKIEDWDNGCFEIIADSYPNLTEHDINLWFEVFESAVKNAIGVLHINASTQEILAFAYFICSDFIFGDHSAPMELFFEKKNVFAVVPYGIEEKFWIIGKPVPILNEWFEYPYRPSTNEEHFFKTLKMPVTENALNGLIVSFLADNYAGRFAPSIKAGFVDECAELLVPEGVLNREGQLAKCKNILAERYDYYAESFNPFTDTVFCEVRSSLVYLSRQLLRFINKLRSLNAVPSDFKNQSSLIISQIINKLLQCFEFLLSMTEDEYGYIDIMTVSLENLSYVYTDVKVDIINTLSAMEKNKGYR